MDLIASRRRDSPGVFDVVVGSGGVIARAVPNEVRGPLMTIFRGRCCTVYIVTSIDRRSAHTDVSSTDTDLPLPGVAATHTREEEKKGT